MSAGRWLAMAACVIGLSGCGGGDGDDDNSPPPALQSIAIAPTSASIRIGETQQFTATGTFSDGHTENLAGTVSWSSTVAQVASVNSQGVASAVAGGATSIKATMGSISTQTTLTVALPAGWTFEVHSPRNGTTSGPTLFVAASIEGPGEIDSVAALEGGNSTSLTFFNSHPQCLDSGGLPSSCWAGDVSLPGGFGAHHVITIRAQDALGNSAAVTRDVVLDQPPTIEVAAPTAGTVARPQLQLSATCSDDAAGGCVSLTAAVCAASVLDCSDPVAQGTGSIAMSVDLQAYNGRSRLLRYLGTDTSGQQTATFIPIFVEDSQHLQNVETVPGTILDVDATRVLHLSGDTLTLSDRTSSNGTDIQSSAAEQPQSAFLTTAGAAFVVRLENPTRTIARSWEQGANVDLGEADELSAAGSYVLWSDGSQLTRRNVDTATDEPVSSNALNSGNSIIASGTVAFAQRDTDIYNIAVLEAGETTPNFLTSDTTLANTYPRSDGTSFLYRKHEPCCTNVTYRLILNSNGSEQMLTGPTVREFVPDSGYQIAGGWVAYLKEGPTGVLQVWRIEPGEQPMQLSAFGTDSRLERLAADGTVIFVSGGRRYLVAADESSPADIGSDLGTSFLVGGLPHVAIGGTLFLVQ
jgi:hypothetical protein